MKVQWVIIAKEYQKNSDGTIDIRKILDRITVNKENNKTTFYIIAKVVLNPIEVSENKKIQLQISQGKGDFSVLYDFASYSIPDLNTWGNKTPYIITLVEKQELPYSGDYTFALWVDDEYKNEATIGVSYS